MKLVSWELAVRNNDYSFNEASEQQKMDKNFTRRAPRIFDDVTLNKISPLLPWKDSYVLSSVRRDWEEWKKWTLTQSLAWSLRMANRIPTILKRNGRNGRDKTRLSGMD